MLAFRGHTSDFVPFFDIEDSKFESGLDGLNWYLYVGNNPLVYVDPTGLLEQEADIEPDDSSSIQDPVSGNYDEKTVSAKESNDKEYLAIDQQLTLIADGYNNKSLNPEQLAQLQSHLEEMISNYLTYPKFRLKSNMFNQLDWNLDTVGKKFNKTACAVTSLLNGLSAMYTSLSGKKLSKDQANVMMRQAIDDGQVESSNAYVNSWQGAANSMWTSLVGKGANINKALSGRYVYNPASTDVGIVGYSNRDDGYINHWMVQKGYNNAYDPYRGSDRSFQEMPHSYNIQRRGLDFIPSNN